MTIAELHGKLSPSKINGVNDRMEDLLTSDVFGTMKYAGWHFGFIDWFLKAQPAPIDPTPPPIQNFISPTKIKLIEYRFWPTLSNKREPDLAIHICIEDKKHLLVVVEAKYFSETSDWENDSVEDPLGLTGNQVADQIRGISSMSNRELLDWFSDSKKIKCKINTSNLQIIHLFVTMHLVLPKYVYEKSAEHLPEICPVPCYWVSWNCLAGCLKPYLDVPDQCSRYLIHDLYNLLHKKNLIPFEGFRSKFWHSDVAPLFWKEKWWSREPILVEKYRPFWN